MRLPPCFLYNSIAMKKTPQLTVKRIDHEDSLWKTRFNSFYSDCSVKKLHGQAHAYFAAFAGEEIAGHCVIYRGKGRWIMDGLRVAPEWREKGVAKALTAARITYAASKGAKEIWYHCEDGNLVTTCCHIRFGFEKVCTPSGACTPASVNWYRLRITPELIRRLPSLGGQQAA